MIRRHVELTQRLAELVAADDRFEIVAPHPLNLLVLRVTGDDAADDDVLTDALIEAANATGKILFDAHRARRPRRAALLDRRLGHRVAPCRSGLAAHPAARAGLTRGQRGRATQFVTAWRS